MIRYRRRIERVPRIQTMPARFSYIDAKGKEVEIGGTAQLMQRIRLGAIDGATQLYDAAGDRWAPAEEHPIYQELAAAVEEETPAAGSPGPESPEASPAPSEEPAAPEPPASEHPASEPEAPPAESPLQESEGPAEADEPAETAGPPEAAEPAEVDEADEADEEGGFEEMDFGLTLSGEEGSAEAAEAEQTEEAEEAPEEDRPDPFEMEMGPAAGASEEEEGEPDEPDEETSLEFGDEPLAAEAPAGEEAQEEADDEEASFDFGDEPLELEETEEEEEAEEAAEASDAGEGGMDLESPLDHLGVEDDQDSEGSGGFEEGSLVAGAADEDWARSDDEEDSWEPEPEEPESGGPEAEEPEPADRSAPAGDRRASAEGEDAGTEPPREKRARPARPPSRKSSSWGSWLTLILLVGILAGGGWAGYTFLLGGGEDSAEAQGPGPAPWATRTVPPELQEPAASVRDEAASRTSAWIQEVAEAQEIPDRPPQEWLDGIYLAHASEYSEVETYFSGLQSLVGEVRSRTPERFLDEYQAVLAGTDLQEGPRTRLRGWMQEDMEWSQFQRDSVYLLLETMIGSALDLHALLVEREDDIRYELMDAIPSSDALQSEIDGHLDRLTRALDELNALGQVSTTRVVEILQQNLRESLGPDAGAAPAGGGGQPQGNS